MRQRVVFGVTTITVSHGAQRVCCTREKSNTARHISLYDVETVSNSSTFADCRSQPFPHSCSCLSASVQNQAGHQQRPASAVQVPDGIRVGYLTTRSLTTSSNNFMIVLSVNIVGDGVLLIYCLFLFVMSTRFVQLR